MHQNECNNHFFFNVVKWSFVSITPVSSDKRFSTRRAPQSEGRCMSLKYESNRDVWYRCEQTINWQAGKQTHLKMKRYSLGSVLALRFSVLQPPSRSFDFVCVCRVNARVCVCDTQIKEARGWRRLLWHLEASTGSSAHLFIDKDMRGTNTSHYIAN